MAASAPVRRVFRRLLAANLAVVGAKLAVGLASGSLAILGSALDSAVDALNNVLALVVVGVAAKEPDEEHPYGHHKFETLGALAIVGFLSITCFELVRGAVNHLLGGTRRVAVSDAQLAVLVLTLGANAFIARYEHRRGTALGSELLVADAAHTRRTCSSPSGCSRASSSRGAGGGGSTPPWRSWSRSPSWRWPTGFSPAPCRCSWTSGRSPPATSRRPRRRSGA